MATPTETTPTQETPETEKPKSWFQKLRLRLIISTVVAVVLVVVISVVIIMGGLWLNIVTPVGDIGDYFPEPDGYNRTNVLTDAVTTAVTWVADWKGFDSLANSIEKFDTYVDCYREEGVFDARIYASNIDLTDAPPAVGLLLLVNPERAQELGGCQQEGFTTQSVDFQPCYGYGNFENDAQETINFVFVASNDSLCQTFAVHFNDTYEARTFVSGFRN
ncbi:MAG: hypothetical protein RLP44_15330 [Aggregatilineales bacterium]